MAKSLCILLLSFGLMAAMAHSVQAAYSEIYITVSEADDGLHEATISITNNPGIAGYNLAIEFDSTILTPVSIVQGDTLASGMVFISNLSGAEQEDMADMDTITAVWGAAINSIGNGAIYTILFEASPGATGSTELRLVSRGIVNGDGDELDFILTGAVINFGGGVLGGVSVTIIIIALLILVIIALLIILLLKRRKDKPNKNRYQLRNS